MILSRDSHENILIKLYRDFLEFKIFTKNCLDLGLIQKIGLIRNVRIILTFRTFRAIRIFSQLDSHEISLRSHNNLMRFL